MRSLFATTAVLLACAALLNASPVRVAHLQQVFVPVLAGYDVGQGLRVNLLQRGLLQNLYKYVVGTIWPNSVNQQEEQQEEVEEDQEQEQFNSAMKPNYPAISVQEGEYVVGPIEYAGQFWYFHYPEKPTYHNRPTSQDEKGSISQVGIVSSAQNEEDLPQVGGIHSVPKAGLSTPPKDENLSQEEGSTPLPEIEEGNNNEDQESSTSQTEEIPEGRSSSLPQTEETTTLPEADAGKPEQEAEGILSKNSVPLPATRTVGESTITETPIKSAGVAGQVGGSRLPGFENIYYQAVHPVHTIPVEMADLAGQAGNVRIYPYYSPPVAYFG